MQDKVDVIQQHPLGLVVAFYAVGALAGFGELLLHFVGNGLDLAGVGPGTNYEIVGECTAVPVHLQNGDIFAFFAFNSLDRVRNLLPDLETHPFLWLLSA